MTPRALSLLALLSFSAAACSGGSYDAAGSPDTGGGNVGFGGAQDIGQFRDILARGGIPGPSTLDAGGFYSEHYIEMPPADCGGVLCARGMLSVGSSWLDGSYQAALQLSLTTTREPDDGERPPLSLVVVIDRSGSMIEDDRLAYVIDGLHLLADELRDDDRVALVAYSDTSEVLLESTPGTERAAVHAAIDTLVAGGSTNLYAGLEQGFELARAGFDPARQNRVIFLSDGLATAGILADDAIVDMADDYIEEGIGLTTIGVGDEFDAPLMRGLAERCAGNFYYLEDSAAVVEVFTEEIDLALVPLALGVNLEVEMAPGYELGAVSGTRLWKTEGQRGAMHLPAVFVASRESDQPGEYGRRGGGGALFIEAIPTGAAAGEVVATVRLRYRLPGSDEILEEVALVENPAGLEAPAEPYYSHGAAAEGYAMYNLYLGLQAAAATAQFDYACALAALEGVAASGERWNLEHGDEDIAADLALVAAFRENLLAVGATPGATWCDGAYDPEPWGDDPYGDDVYYRQYACSAGGGAGGAGAGLVVLLGLALAARPRRCRAARGARGRRRAPAPRRRG